MDTYGYASVNKNVSRGTLIEVHMADLHFGAFNPYTHNERGQGPAWANGTGSSENFVTT